MTEDVAKFTLKDPISLTDYGTLDFDSDDVDSSDLTISTQGKVYRPSKTASSGLPIELLGREFIGEYVDNQIDHYQFHHFTDDLSSIVADDTLIFQERRIAIESNILLENNLLESSNIIIPIPIENSRDTELVNDLFKLDSNNSSYSSVAIVGEGSGAAAASRGTGTSFVLLDITDTSNCKVKFEISSASANTYVFGNNNPSDTSSGYPQTYAIFKRLGDT